MHVQKKRGDMSHQILLYLLKDFGVLSSFLKRHQKIRFF